MTIQSEVRIIDATIDKVTPSQIFLSTVTAHLEYKTAEYLRYRIEKLIPMSQPGVILPSLVMPTTEVRRLPLHLQNKVQAELKRQEAGR